METLTIKQAAAEYQSSEKTIRRYIAQKLIPSVQAGKGTLIRIPLEAWRKFIEGKKRL
jgi:excisionase family DNA binding protein